MQRALLTLFFISLPLGLAFAATPQAAPATSDAAIATPSTPAAQATGLPSFLQTPQPASCDPCYFTVQDCQDFCAICNGFCGYYHCNCTTGQVVFSCKDCKA